MKSLVIPGFAMHLHREGKGIHGLRRFLDALPSRFALAGHDNIDSM